MAPRQTSVPEQAPDRRKANLVGLRRLSPRIAPGTLAAGWHGCCEVRCQNPQGGRTMFGLGIIGTILLIIIILWLLGVIG